MKKSIKSVLAKSLAVVMAFSLAGIAPSTSSDAAAKKPTLTKKVTVTVGKKKTVKVTSKKKVKKTTWSLTKKGKKVVSLSKKKKTSVVVKGKKKGTATLTAKIKVGKKTYKKTCKVTVKKATTSAATPKTTQKSNVTPTPAGGSNNGGGSTNNGGNNATPTPVPTEKPVDTIKTENGTLTVNEADTYNVQITALNETTFTSPDKRSDGETIADGTVYNRDGSVTFTSLKTYNSGVSYYINPCTSEDQLVDISETRGEGFLGYNDGTKDMSAYDYIRVKLTSSNEMNMRAYNGNDQLLTAGFPGSSNAEVYEGGWIQTDEDIWEAESTFDAGKTVKEQYATRTVFIPISSLTGMNPETLTAIAFCPQGSGAEVTIHRIDFVKVNYDKKVTGIEVTAKKTEIQPGKTTTVTAAITPKDATRQMVKWSSSDEEIATVNFAGTVVAKDKTGEVTITATSTDGSNVTGTTKIKVAEPSEDPVEIKTHKVDLTKVVAKTNPGEGEGEAVAATQTAASIEFMNGKAMAIVDFADYLDKNNLDLSNYDELKVTWEVRDDKGNVVKDYEKAEGTPTYGKIAYVPAAKLDGYSNGIDVDYKGEDDTEANTAWLASPYVGQTCTLTIAKTNPVDLATVAGFNLQLSSLPENMSIFITDITLYKDESVSVKISADAKYADGCLVATGSAATADPIYGEDGSVTYTSSNQYNGGGMAFYLSADKEPVDLSEYSGIKIVIEGTEGAGIKLCPYTPATPNNYLNSTTVGSDYGLTLTGKEQTYTLDFTADETKWGKRGEAYALGILYNAYGVGNYDEDDARYATIKVKSITLVK